MKLWPTITENKCFVKMLWHLLGECVKNIVLLVCSICIVHRFFFSSKCLALPNGLEIRRVLLFHVTETLTPKALWSWGNSVLTAIPRILLSFFLVLELRRTRLLAIFIKSFNIGILHKLFKLPRDIGFHLRISIV